MPTVSPVDREPPTDSAQLLPLLTAMLSSVEAGAIAITGAAGAGKTHVAGALGHALGCPVYSADFRFIGDTGARRELLERKQARSVSDYRDSANQYNWWDWTAIERDVATLLAGGEVLLEAPYDRRSGARGETIRIGPARRLLVEGAILGPPQLIDRFARIVFLCTPPRLRFQRVVAKDAARRSFNEIAARFLITEYSETIYYRNLFNWARGQLAFVDTDQCRLVAQPPLPSDLFVPLRVAR
jgi:uridine kinase